MNKIKNYSSLKQRLFICVVVFGGLFFGSLSVVNAQNPVTFGQFFERAGGQDFIFTNSTTGATLSTVSGGSPVFFVYQNINNLDSSLQGVQNARVIVSVATTTPATTTSGTNLTQPINSSVSTIMLIRDTPAPAGVGTGLRTNLLTVTFSPNVGTPDITGNAGNTSTALSAGSGDNIVTFSSDFLTFSATTARALALSFSSVSPSLSIGNGGFLNSFTAASSGTFSSNPAPTIVNATTAAAVTVSGRVLTPTGRGLRNAQVTVLDADGTTRTVLTSFYGAYSFSELAAGQTFTLAVRSKTYRYMPQLVTPGSDLSGVDFTPENR